MNFPWISDPQIVLARTIWGENRSGGYIGMQSVANVVINRAAHPRWWGKSPLTVCLDREQFSTWNALTDGEAPDANFLATIAVTDGDQDFRYALQIAQLALAKALPDITEGADSYYALTMTEAPPWTAKARHTLDLAGQSFWVTT
ncbi:MAG: cell wall hydrolase [Betaproteobacteria bacterium]|nr:cell wall hydrolase [Betaproteobacteria bacterium]